MYIIITDLITLLSIYLLWNLHLSQTVGGIRLSLGKEIHPTPEDQGCVLGICELYDTNVLFFC